MAKGLATLRRRITSIKATKKVTKAMQMIATTKLKSWKQAMLDAKDYAFLLVDLMQRHLKNDELLNAPYFKENDAKGSLFILITSNLGLCGPYNYNIISSSTSTLKKEDSILIIGEKGSRYLKPFSFEVDRRFVSSSHLHDIDIAQVSDALLSAFLTKQVKGVHILYTQFVNNLISRPTFVQLLPLTLPKDIKPLPASEQPTIEPDPLAVLTKLVPFYLKNTLYSTMIESQVCEQSSRRNAMEKASDNADELIEQLQLDYNKQRQANITQEIAEIIGGSAT
jgi:F-type H+-transporting ATPase subunit gamma